MKKLLALLLCLLFLLTSLTACGTDTNSRDKDDDDHDRRPSHKDDEDEEEDEEKEEGPASVVIHAYGLEVALNTPKADFENETPERMSLSLPDRIYGLNELALLPAGLQMENEQIPVNSPLYYPIYGADGRVYSLGTDLWCGAYDADANQFLYHRTARAEGVYVLGIGGSSSTPNSSDTLPITSTYGCVIDLLLRCATDCKVVIPARDATGSVTFTLTDTFTKIEAQTWAEAFRITFYNDTGKFLGTVSLDTTRGRTNKDQYTLPLILTDYSEKGDIYREGELCDLSAGEATAISALMYLDGNCIANTELLNHSNFDYSVELRFKYSDPFY